MVARNLMNHDVAGDITPTKCQVPPILCGPALRPKQQQSSWIDWGDILLANRGKYNDVAANPVRDRKLEESTNQSTDFPSENVESTGEKLTGVRSDIVQPGVNQISSVL